MTAQEFNQLFGGVLFETLKNPDLAKIMETDGVATNLNNLMQELSQAAARAYSWVNKNLKEGEDIQKLFNDDGAKLMRACYTKLAAVNDRFKGLSSNPKYSGRITAETRKLFDRVSNAVGKKEENVENIGGKLNSAEKIKVNKGYYFPDSQFSNQYKIDTRKSQNNLFAHIPCAEDVVQEDNLACYFLAPLRVIAAKHPEKILDLVHDNGDGTVTFKLYPLDGNMDTNFTGKKNEMLITVDNTLPGIDPQSRRWVRLFEKALAASRTMNIAGHMPDKDDLKKKIDMNSFEGGEPLVSLSVLDPTNSGSYTGREKANKMLVSMNNMLDVNKVLAKQINDAKEKGKLMCLCSGVHVFTVTDIETDIAGEVTLKCYDQQRQKNFDVTLDSMLEGKSYERYDRFVIYDYGDQGKSHDASYFSLNEIRNSVQLHSMDPNYKVPLRTKDWVDGVLNGEITSQVEFAEEDNKKLEELIDKILDAGIFDDIYELTDVWGRIDHIKKGTYKEDLPLDDYEKEYLNDLTREHLWIRLSEMRKENEVAPENNEEQKPEEQHVEEVKLEEPVKQAEAPMPNDISLGIAYREMMRHNDVISSILECRPDDYIMPEGLSENEKTAELLKLLQNDSMRLSKLNDDDRNLMMVKIDSVLSAWRHGDYDDKLAIPTSVKAHRDLITAEVLYDRIAKIQDQNEINYTKILADAKKANEEIFKEESKEEPVPVKEEVKEEIVQEEVKEEPVQEEVKEEVKNEAVQEEVKEDPVQEEVPKEEPQIDLKQQERIKQQVNQDLNNLLTIFDNQMIQNVMSMQNIDEYRLPGHLDELKERAQGITDLFDGHALDKEYAKTVLDQIDESIDSFKYMLVYVADDLHVIAAENKEAFPGLSGYYDSLVASMEHFDEYKTNVRNHICKEAGLEEIVEEEVKEEVKNEAVQKKVKEEPQIAPAQNEVPQQVITSQAVAFYDVKYGNVLNKLAKDLESTKGFFTRDSDAFKRLNEYLNSVDDFSNLDKDALDEAIDNIRGLVNDYQNHMKNKPIDNDRRRNREGIADKLSAICDEYSSDEPKNYADSIINRDECYGVIKEELGKKAGYDIPALKDAFGRLMIMNIMDAKAHGKHQLGSFDEDAVSDYAEKFANTDTVMKMIKDVDSLKALVADYEANPGLLSTKTESKLAADMLKNMANEKNIDKKLADERTVQQNDNSMQM